MIKKTLRPLLLATAALFIVMLARSDEPAQGRSLETRAPTSAEGSLAEYMKRSPRRILHGWGQGFYRWDPDGVAYMRAIPNRPVVVSSYLRLFEIPKDRTRLSQLEFFDNGWTDPATRRNHRFITLLGVGLNRGTYEQVRGIRTARLLEELGLSEAEVKKARAAAGTGGVFERLVRSPQAWQRITAHLESRGFDTSGLERLPQMRPEERRALQPRIRALKDALERRVSEKLRDDGFPFADLEVIAGKYDAEIQSLGRAIAEVDSPVIVRFLFESIHGIHQNAIFGPETFRQAWQRFARLLRESGAHNAELLFHPNTGDAELLNRFYPGDDVVDWVGCSLFDPRSVSGCVAAARWAAGHGKPFAVCESAPTSERFRAGGAKDPAVWRGWFEPYFRFLTETDNLRLFVYISVDFGRLKGEFSHWGNTGVDQNTEVKRNYSEQLSRNIFLNNEEFWPDFERYRRSSTTTR